jgi:hypothetical protein
MHADFDDVFNLNTRAQFFVGKNALKHLQPGGRLVLMSSIAAGVGVPGHALYAGSKSAVEGFTRCFAADFGQKSCTVNAIAPAGVKTDMWTANSWRYAPGCTRSSSLEEIEVALAQGSPLGRCGIPQDIGRIVAFLASPGSEWLNGKQHPVSGVILISSSRGSNHDCLQFRADHSRKWRCQHLSCICDISGRLGGRKFKSCICLKCEMRNSCIVFLESLAYLSNTIDETNFIVSNLPMLTSHENVSLVASVPLLWGAAVGGVPAGPDGYPLARWVPGGTSRPEHTSSVPRNMSGLDNA